jgi:hypothetical protein
VEGEIRHVEEVHHSRSDRHGEADLVVIATALADGGALSKRVALLIENKITAPAQLHQAARYRNRGIEGVGTEWSEFRTVLVAPEAYQGERELFDVFISLERISAWFSRADVARGQFRRQKLANAIQKKSASGVQNVDPFMTAFHRGYYEFVQEFNIRAGSRLQMDKPGPKWAGDNWIYLKAHELPQPYKVRHQMQTSMKAATGLIEISFPNTCYERAAEIKELLQHGMRLVANGRRGQHVAIESNVPLIEVRNGFAAERQKVETALSRALDICGLYIEHRDQIEFVLERARLSGCHATAE